MEQEALHRVFLILLCADPGLGVADGTGVASVGRPVGHFRSRDLTHHPDLLPSLMITEEEEGPR